MKRVLLAPLGFIPSYAALSAEQRARYHQLFVVYVNEQTAFFEEQIAETLLPPLIADPKLPVALRSGLGEFLGDERSHSRMFRALNSALDPALYPPGWTGYRFVRPAPAALRLLRATASRPRAFPFWIWVMLAQEEMSLHFGRCVLRQGDKIDPRVASTHRIHLADETNHVAWDLDLIEALWSKAPPLIRALNARILRFVMREFFTAPRRSNMEVARQLAAEFPALAPRLPQWRREMTSLGRDPAYHRAVYSGSILRRTFAGFRRFPELHRMADVFLEFDPHEES